MCLAASQQRDRQDGLRLLSGVKSTEKLNTEIVPLCHTSYNVKTRVVSKPFPAQLHPTNLEEKYYSVKSEEQ